MAEISELEKLMRASRRGCIDDREEIADILDRISRLSLTEAREMGDIHAGEALRTLADIYLNREWGLNVAIDERFMDSMGFMELLCLTSQSELKSFTYMDATGRTRETDPAKITSAQQTFRYIGLVNIFRLFEEAGSRSNLIRMFRAITVKELLSYLEIKDMVRQAKEPRRQTFRVVKKRFEKNARMLGIVLDKNTTVEDVLAKTKGVRQVSWSPWYPVEEYCNHLKAVFAIWDILLLDCFRYACPEKFCLNHVLEKYQVMERQEEFTKSNIKEH